MNDDFRNIDAIGQAELVRSGQVSAAELVEAAIQRIEGHADLNALAATNFDAARERARQSPQGPLAGVPFLIKDLIPYPRLRHSLGSRLFAQNVPADPTPLSQRFDDVGLIVLGKTTTSELGLLGSTETLLEGVTRNPWCQTRSAGGSSGGSAAAVAARLVPMAHANDGGGSIRIPAAINGVFGLKPSGGRIVSAGIDDMGGLLSEHCVSWSVRDSALLLSLTEQPLPNQRRVGFVDGPTPERMKIGVYSSTLMGQAPESVIAASLEKTAALCRQLGHEVIDMAPPELSGPDISAAFFTMAGSGIQQLAKMVEPILGRRVGSQELEPFTLALLAWFEGLDDGALDRAQRVVEQCEVEMARVLDEFDVVLCPTIPIEPPELGTLSPSLARTVILERTERLAGYTPIHNMAKVPGMNVPLHWTDDGLPIGSHFAARFGGEATLLKLAYELEYAAPWRNRTPPSAK